MRSEEMAEPLGIRAVRPSWFEQLKWNHVCVIFFEGEWKNANVYDYCVVMVENSDEDLQVTFYLTDAHEMNWVTEFL